MSRSLSVWLLMGLGLALAIVACGRIPGQSSITSPTASDSRTSAPTADASPLATPTTPNGWTTYTDSQFAFSIGYPPNFTFQKEGPIPRPGDLMNYRVVDNRFLTGYPPGQVEIGIYQKDADTLAAWVELHRGDAAQTNTVSTYWTQTSNISATTAAGRNAVSFDWTAPGVTTPVHTTAFFIDTSHVFLLSWDANDSSYAQTVMAIAAEMLSSFKG